MFNQAKWLLVAFVLGGCASQVLSPQLRSQSAQQVAAVAGWEPIRVPAGNFVLAGFVPKNPDLVETLTIYIEGDGLAWINSSTISSNPTPLHAVGLELALRQPSGMAAYLARPCQYVENEDARNCAQTWWTDARFAAEVVQSENLAIDALKQRFHARNIELVGYSGGGAVALLTAVSRTDVVRVITVAGNLDHAFWTKSHHASPLIHSLNPADAWQNLLDIPQIHLIGGKDNNVGYAVAKSYQSRFPLNHQPKLKVIQDFDHACCWTEKWFELYKESILQ